MELNLPRRLALALPGGLVIAALACSLGGPAAPALPPTEVPPSGTITFATASAAESRVYRIPAKAGEQLEDVSAALDSLSPGAADTWLNISPDGAWLVLESDRFHPDCAGWPCLAVLPASLARGEAVRVENELAHASGLSAIGPGGNLLVFPNGGGPHELDLWAVRREAGAWGAPLLLTEASPYAWNDVPAISADGAKVLFDCGDQPYGAAGTALCEAGTDGSGFRVALTPEQGPDGAAENALHHADYAPDGSIVFEADWYGEQVWRLPAGGGRPAPVNPDFTNDNSPCVLPDGRIASLWLQRPGGDGLHEIKVMSADGASYEMALTGIDVLGVGIGCGA